MSAAANKYKNVLFDLDGVLIDNSEGIIATARYVIENMGMPQPPDDVMRKFIGPHMGYNFKTYANLSEVQAREALKIYRSKYLFMGIDMYSVYDGVEETLKALYDAGVICTVSSNKPTDVVKYILSTASFERYVHEAFGAAFSSNKASEADTVERAIAARPALIVGDRAFDIKCAENAGCDSALVTYGFGTPEERLECNPTYIIDDIRQLIKIV